MVEPGGTGGNDEYTSMADRIGCDDKEKSLYLVQIWYLEEQLERCGLKCEELEKEHKDLWTQYKVLEKDKNTVTEKLKSGVAAKQKKVEELAEQLEEQRRQSKLQREALELQQQQEVEDVEEQTSKVEAETKTQAVTMEEQEEQLMEVRQRVSYTRSLQEQLFGRREAYEAEARCLRTELQEERDNSVATAQSKADECLHRELDLILGAERRQHEERKEWLQFLLRNKEPLEEKMKLLQASEEEVQARARGVWEEQQEKERERYRLNKEVKKLKERRLQLLEERRDWDASELRQQVHCLREQVSSVSEACGDKSAAADGLEAELQQETSRSRQLDRVRQEAAVILRHVLTDSERRGGAEAQRLLEILESTAPQGGASSLSQPPGTRRRRRRRNRGQRAPASRYQN